MCISYSTHTEYTCLSYTYTQTYTDILHTHSHHTIYTHIHITYTTYTSTYHANTSTILTTYTHTNITYICITHKHTDTRICKIKNTFFLHIVFASICFSLFSWATLTIAKEWDQSKFYTKALKFTKMAAPLEGSWF